MVARRVSDFHRLAVRAYCGAKFQAKQRKQKFTLTKAQAFELMSSPCVYCGGFFSYRLDSGDRQLSAEMNGIDRVDNTLGYTKANSVPCCWKCNKAKAGYSAAEYIEHCIKVAEKSYACQ